MIWGITYLNWYYICAVGVFFISFFCSCIYFMGGYRENYKNKLESKYSIIRLSGGYVWETEEFRYVYFGTIFPILAPIALGAASFVSIPIFLLGVLAWFITSNTRRNNKVNEAFTKRG